MRTAVRTVFVNLSASILALVAASTARADDWPQWGGPQRDGVYRESGVVRELPETPDYRWRTDIGAGYAGPAVADGRVFVTDRILEEGERNPDNPFQRVPVRGVERVLCLDAKTGEELWKHVYPCRYTLSYPTGPRATPTVDGARVYTLGAMGNLFCFRVTDGEILWKKSYTEDFGTEMNVWGMSAAPLVDGKKLILLAGGSEGAGVVALNKLDGKEIWRSVEGVEDPGYASPIIIRAGGTRQLIVWTPEHLRSLDPETGKVYWEEPFSLESNLSVATPIFDAERHLLLVTSFYNGPLMMQLARDEPKAEVLWRGTSNSERQTDKLHGLMCTPVFDDGYIYGVGAYGQLRCLEAKTGKRLWETFEATGEDRWWNAFLVPYGDHYIIANEQGELITAELSPQGYREISRMKVLEPTNKIRRRMVVWSHPAFANQAAYMRNDKEIVCVDLSSS